MIQARGFDSFFRGDLADFEADTRIWPIGVFCICNDGSQMRIGDGLNEFPDLKPIYEQNMHPAAKIALTGTNTPLPTTPSTFSAETDAQTAVAALAVAAQSHISALEAKVDALIAALITAGSMNAS